MYYQSTKFNDENDNKTITYIYLFKHAGLKCFSYDP